MRVINTLEFINELRKLKKEVDRGTQDINTYINMSVFLNALYRLGLTISFITDNNIGDDKIASVIDSILQRMGGELRISPSLILKPSYVQQQTQVQSQQENLSEVQEATKDKDEEINTIKEEIEKEGFDAEELVKEAEKEVKAVDDNDVENFFEIAKKLEDERYEIRKYIENKNFEVEIKKQGKKFGITLTTGKKNKLTIIIPTGVEISFDTSVHGDIEKYLSDRNIHISTLVGEQESNKDKVEKEEKREVLYEVEPPSSKGSVEKEEERISHSDMEHKDEKTEKTVSVMEEKATDKIKKKVATECKVDKTGLVERILKVHGEITKTYEKHKKKYVRFSKKDVEMLFRNARFFERRTKREYNSLYEIIMCKILQSYDSLRNLISNMRSIVKNTEDFSEEEKKYIIKNAYNFIRLSLIEYLGDDMFNENSEKFMNIKHIREDELKGEIEFLRSVLDTLS